MYRFIYCVSAASSLLFIQMHICQTFITENITAGLPLVSIPSLPTVQQTVAVGGRTEIFQELGGLSVRKYPPVVPALVQLLLRSDQQPHVPRSEVILLHHVDVVLGLQVLLAVVLLLFQLLLGLYPAVEFGLELYLVAVQVISLHQRLSTITLDDMKNIFSFTYVLLFRVRFTSVMKSNNIEHLSYHRIIDVAVQRGLLHGGEVVELQQPGLEFLIKEKINTKQLVAVVVTLAFFFKH